MKIVIVGGVAGGASAAARLRRLDELAEIIILERGRFISFANCGLPYHISGDIPKRRDLLMATPETFRDNFNIEVRTGHEVTAIDRSGHTVTVRETATGRLYQEPYDRLILSQGAAPVRLDMPGADHPRIFSLRTMDDMDAVKELADGHARTAAVVGSGYVGLEAAEALVRRGISVHLIEIQKQVLPIFDPEMTSDLAAHLEQKGVRLHLDDSLESIRDKGGRAELQLRSSESLIADIVLVAIGVRPETALAQAAGLDVGTSGGLVVDDRMRTSDPEIYAAGDMVEVQDMITASAAVMPLAGPANRQGRIAADNICGRPSSYSSTQGTAVVKVFDMTAAVTGATEKTLRRAGRPFRKIYIWPFGHAIYYPGTSHMHIKVLFDPEDGTLLGAQIVGFDGVDKRIDVFAVAIRCGLGVYDLEHLELAYAPPYGSAKDPVNMAGFVGANVLNGDLKPWYCEEHPAGTSGGTVMDVRTEKEFAAGAIPGSVNIPLDEIRRRIDEISQLAQPLYLYCLTGIRSYIGCRIINGNGIEETYNLAGGWKTWECYTRSV